MNFSKEGYICYVEQFKNEPFEHFMDRGYFIVSQKPQTRKEYDDVLRLSRLYINILVNGCKYDDEVMKKIEGMMDKILTK